MFYALVVLCLFGNALARVPTNSSCPELQTMQGFDLSEYMGRWYEAERYDAPWEFGAECVVVDYNLREDGTSKVARSFVSQITGNISTSEANLLPVDPYKPGKLKMTFPAIPGVEAGYWVLGTDYDSFAVVYGCAPKSTYAWIFTREQNPAAKVIAKADKVIAHSGISRTDFIKTNQKDCGQS